MSSGAPSSHTSTQQHTNAAAASKPSAQQAERPKICCACPETKRARDECVIERGEAACAALIETHKQCLRTLGFDV